MTTATKDVYTPEIRAAMEQEYTSATDEKARMAVVEKFANMVGKSPASVRQIMNRAGYYIKKVYAKKNGKPVVKKGVKVAKVADKIGLSEDVCNSLEKTTGKVLDSILARFAAYENDILALV